MKHHSLHTLQPSSAHGTYCPILLFDVVGFGGRDNEIQMRVRAGLHEILDSAFEHVNVTQTAYYRADNGDGVLIVVPPTISVHTIASLPIWLHAEIQRHNKYVSSAARIQLRAALHVGPVYWDDHGVGGQAIVHAARLVEAQPTRNALASADADLVFVVSATVYNEVIRHSPQPADTIYRKIEAQVKESSITAWITVSGGDAPRGRSDRSHYLTVVPDDHLG